jgi:hypothetical protein
VVGENAENEVAARLGCYVTGESVDSVQCACFGVDGTLYFRCGEPIPQRAVCSTDRERIQKEIEIWAF